jgi:uncharacterized protein (DUF1778 family)
MRRDEQLIHRAQSLIEGDLTELLQALEADALLIGDRDPEIDLSSGDKRAWVGTLDRAAKKAEKLQDLLANLQERARDKWPRSKS